MYYIEKVGAIRVGEEYLHVYNDVNQPLFLASEVALVIDYSAGSVRDMIDLCEDYETLKFDISSEDGRESIYFVDECGLYSILSRNSDAKVRKWRGIVYKELEKMRHKRACGV